MLKLSALYALLAAVFASFTLPAKANTFAERESAKAERRGCEAHPRWQALLGVDGLAIGVRSIEWKNQNTLIISGYISPLSCQKLPDTSTKVWRPEPISRNFRANLDISTHWSNSFATQIKGDSSFIVEVSASSFFTKTELSALGETGVLENKELALIIWGLKSHFLPNGNQMPVPSTWSTSKTLTLNFKDGKIEFKEQKK